jgi:hypothetical protein
VTRAKSAGANPGDYREFAKRLPRRLVGSLAISGEKQPHSSYREFGEFGSTRRRFSTNVIFPQGRSSRRRFGTRSDDGPQLGYLIDLREFAP